jgi:hypothetical protein
MLLLLLLLPLLSLLLLLLVSLSLSLSLLLLLREIVCKTSGEMEGALVYEHQEQYSRESVKITPVSNAPSNSFRAVLRRPHLLAYDSDAPVSHAILPSSLLFTVQQPSTCMPYPVAFEAC